MSYATPERRVAAIRTTLAARVTRAIYSPHATAKEIAALEDQRQTRVARARRTLRSR